MPISSDGTLSSSLADRELLAAGECIAVVDDHPDITELLGIFLQQHGFATISAGSAGELWRLFDNSKIALVLLDIVLPDANGVSLLSELRAQQPDTAVVMLTAATSLDTALLCLRHGANDYLTKPVRLDALLNTIRQVLGQRRLALHARQYQHQLEKARQRIERTHRLSISMIGSYLRITDLNTLVQAMLTGITAHEGLGFNRAIALPFSKDRKFLVGRYAIGPISQEEGASIWQDIQRQHLTLDDLLKNLHRSPPGSGDAGLLSRIRGFKIDAGASEHLALRALSERRILVVRNGQAEYPVPEDLIRLLQEDSFVIAPLFSPERTLGVVIVDNFISHHPITAEQLHALESFLSQASLAIEHCSLYQTVQDKVAELEAVTRELHKNQEMLVNSGRYSAVGHMAAQLAHNIKNPIAAIGGTAQFLKRKVADRDIRKFLDMMVVEVDKLEKILADLSSFGDTIEPVYTTALLAEVARNAGRLCRQDMVERHISLTCDFPEELPAIELDPKLIQQVLVHLLVNAMDAMPEGGEIVMRLAAEGEGQALSLLDRGQGIKDAMLRNVTDPFFTTKTVGTGLGLAFVHKVLADHHGHFVLQGRLDGGAEARIWLPAHH